MSQYLEKYFLRVSGEERERTAADLKKFNKVMEFEKDYEAYKSLRRSAHAEKAFDKYEFELEKFLLEWYPKLSDLEAMRQKNKEVAPDDVFTLFCKDRVRKTEATRNEKYTIKEFKKALDRWASATSNRTMNIKDLEQRCEEFFGDSRGKREYCHIRVFLEEEDVEEFDRQEAEGK